MSDIDHLAQEIRRVDGAHTLGAGALAEALGPFIKAARAETLREAVEHINSNGMISRRNLEPYWEGWDDATERAAQEVEALIEKEAGQ